MLLKIWSLFPAVTPLPPKIAGAYALAASEHNNNQVSEKRKKPGRGRKNKTLIRSRVCIIHPLPLV